MSSVGSPDGKWYDGDEGKWDDGDVDINVGDNLHVDEGLSDVLEYKPPGGDDDSLFYSSKGNTKFERELDKVARVIEYSDPKHIHHGRRPTTVIIGGSMRPNYEGMTVTEKQRAKEEYEQKRKAFTDQKQANCLKEVANHTEIMQYTSTLCLLAMGGFRMALIALPNDWISVRPLCVLAAMPVDTSNSLVSAFKCALLLRLGTWQCWGNSSADPEILYAHVSGT